MSAELLCQPPDVLSAWPGFSAVAAAEQSALCAAASSEIIKFCRRPGFIAASYDEAYDGRNLNRIWLRQVPVLSVAAVYIDGDALDNTYGDAWTFDAATGELTRGNGQDDERFAPWFPKGTRNVRVVYWAGYQELPADLVRAAILAVRWLYEITRRPLLYQSESIGDYSYSLANPNWLMHPIPPYIQSLLNPYVLDDGPL